VKNVTSKHRACSCYCHLHHTEDACNSILLPQNPLPVLVLMHGLFQNYFATKIFDSKVATSVLFGKCYLYFVLPWDVSYFCICFPPFRLNLRFTQPLRHRVPIKKLGRCFLEISCPLLLCKVTRFCNVQSWTDSHSCNLNGIIN
jgi:hypothetical protein